MKNHYRVLQVQRNVSPTALKAAHRERCRQTHPDVGGNSEEFADVTTAYQTLADPSKKRDWEAHYLAAAAAVGHVVCLQCFAVNRVRALKQGQHALCAHCNGLLAIDGEERSERYRAALREQMGDLLLTLGAEAGQLAQDAILGGVDAIRRKLKITRR